MAKLNPAMKRYLGRFTASMITYVVVVVAVGWWFRQPSHPEGAFKYVVAILPALPILGVIWAVGRYFVEEPDEYLRMRLARVSLWATGITLAICTAWGFLQTYAGLRQAPLYDVFILYFVVFGLLQGFEKLTERA